MLRQMKESHYKAVFDVNSDVKPLRVSVYWRYLLNIQYHILLSPPPPPRSKYLSPHLVIGTTTGCGTQSITYFPYYFSKVQLSNFDITISGERLSYVCVI